MTSAATILVIEDEAALRQTVAEVLTGDGYTVLAAADGASGLRLAAEARPDLVLCDVMMPNLDGFGVLQQLRAAPATAALPFILVTARRERGDLRRGMDLGADDYLTKPFTRLELLQTVRTRLAKTAAAAALTRQQLDELRASISLALPHELRMPLTSIMTAAETLLQYAEVLTPAELAELGSGLGRSAQRLWRLTDNYLTYVDMELLVSDPARRQAWQTSLTEHIDWYIASTAQEQARLAGRVADLSLRLESVAVNIAEAHLRKMVAALVENAFKFSPAGAVVQVTGSLTGGQYVLSVVDHGVGMSEQELAQAGAYRQFDRWRREQQGAGLGLCLTRRLVDFYGGRFAIASQPGGPTTVTVQLPAGRPL